MLYAHVYGNWLLVEQWNRILPADVPSVYQYCTGIKTHTQAVHGKSYMDTLLSNLKFDFVTCFQLMFHIEVNQFCLFLVQHKDVCTYPGIDICHANVQYA